MHKIYVVLGKKLSHAKYAAARERKEHAIVVHPDAQLRIDALAAICRNGPADIAIFSGGETAGLGLPSEANSMWSRFLNLDYGPRRPACMLDEEALNTEENALRVKSLVEKIQYFKLHVITSGYHARRVNEVFLAHDLNVEVLVAEEVVAHLVPERKEEMERLKKSFHFRLEHMLEFARRMLPRKFLSAVSHVFRG